MLSSKAKSSSRLLGRSLQRSCRVASAATSSTTTGRWSSSSAPSLDSFREMGYVDEDGLVQFDTIHEMQVRACAVYKDNDLFGTYSPEEEAYVWQTYGDYAKNVNICRTVLKDLGVGEFDKVAIISNNRWEWATIACAAHSLNATLVPMYEAQLPSDWIYILNDSGSRAVFCANQHIYDQVQKEVLPSTPGVQASLCLDAAEGEPHAFATAMANATEDADGSMIIKPTPDDLCNLIYTSGTTGKPKGVELTHMNFASNAQDAVRIGGNPRELVLETDRSLSFLPWAHSFGQTSELWSCMSLGAGLGISRGIPLILEDLQLVKPSFLFSVPTLYKKIYDGVNNLMESASPLRKSLMKTALHLGAKKDQHNKGLGDALGPLESLQHKVLDKVVLSKIRGRFGGNLRHGFAGGAATPAEVLNFMDAIGIPICEGYGLTETSPMITINTPSMRCIGSVGKPIRNVTVYIIGEDGKPVPPGEEGEICCVGPNVMKGYYNNKEATDEVISVAPDGKSRMFHTGDLGRLDADNWLRVTGRLKEQYKLENGKYVVPTPIEDAIGLSRFITQVVLVGANRPHNTALLVPEWPAIRQELGIPDTVTEEELTNDERVKDLIDAEIHHQCYKLKKYEIPTKWAIVAPFTAANNMLTPKMSIRRHKVMEAYEDVIATMYGDEAESPKEEAA